jgi:hypothetical protein
MRLSICRVGEELKGVLCLVANITTSAENSCEGPTLQLMLIEFHEKRKFNNIDDKRQCRTLFSTPFKMRQISLGMERERVAYPVCHFSLSLSLVSFKPTVIFS